MRNMNGRTVNRVNYTECLLTDNELSKITGGTGILQEYAESTVGCGPDVNPHNGSFLP